MPEESKINPDASQAPLHDSEDPDIIRTVETQLGQVHTARAEQKRLLQEMLDHQEALERQDVEIAERTKKLEEQASFIQKSEARLAERTAELEAAQAEHAELAAALQAREEEIATEREQLTAELADGRAALDKRESSLSEQEKGLAAREQDLQQRQQELDSQASQIKQQSEALSAEAAEHADAQKKLEAEAAEHRARAEQLTREKEEIEEARSVLEADNSRLRGELSAAEAAGAGAEAASNALNELRASLEARDAQVTKLTERLKAAQKEAESASASTSAETTQLKQRLDDANAEIETLKNAPQPEPEPANEQVAKRDQVIAALTAQLKDAESARASALQQPVSSSARSDIQRRDRLKAVRNSLRDKASRLAQAKQMIDQRQAEVEQVLRLRAQLATEREAIKREKANAGKHSAKAGAGVAVVCAAIAMLALAPVAWKAAGVFAPADHLASARIEITARDGSALSAKRLEGFAATIDEITADPNVIAQAATRMERRGIDAYAQPAALSATLREHLDVTHPTPGSAEISLVDKGSLLTQRVLETYIAAVVAAANDRASARMDNSSVVVTKDPDTTSPVNQTQQAVAAAGIWAGSSLVTLLFFAFISIAMTKARERIRNEESLLNAARDGSGIGWGTENSA